MKITIKTILLLVVALTGCDRTDVTNTAGKDEKKSTTDKSYILDDSFSVGTDVVVRSLAHDRENNTMWVGTTVGVIEIDLVKRQPINSFTRANGLANEYVFAIGIDSQGYKWFGTNAGGVSRYRKGEWKTFFPMHGLADYWIYSFTQQKSGDFWIGTWAGANRVDLDSMKFTTYVKELVNEWVYGLGVDSADNVWFGTEGGVSMYDGKQWQHWTHQDGLGAANTRSLPLSQNTGLGTRTRHDLNVLIDGGESYNPNYVFAIHVTPDDRVWAGTWGGGAGYYDGKQWHNYTIEQGLAGNIVYSITQATDGALWFGTNRGVSRYDGKNWQTYSHADGLLADDVYAIEMDADNNVWVATKHGVAIFKPVARGK